MHRTLARAPWLASLVLSFVVVGCVPYQTYRNVKNELEKAKDANADLVKKYNQAVQKLMLKERAGGGENQALLAEIDRLRNQLAEGGLRPEFSPEQIARVGGTPESGGIALGNALLFAEGSNKLRPEAFRFLDGIVELIRTEYPGEMIIIEGHTDNQPLKSTRGLWKYNMNLAYNRAKAVFEYFLDHGIPESRLVVRAYSFNKPVDPLKVDTKEGRRENRRVVVRRGGTRI